MNPFLDRKNAEFSDFEVKKAKKSRFWAKIEVFLRKIQFFPVFGHFLTFLRPKTQNFGKNPAFRAILSKIDQKMMILENFEKSHFLSSFWPFLAF